MTSRESDKFMLRLPDGLRSRIRVMAELHRRSMNAEIVAVLEERYPEHRLDMESLLKFVRSAAPTTIPQSALEVLVFDIGDQIIELIQHRLNGREDEQVAPRKNA